MGKCFRHAGFRCWTRDAGNSGEEVGVYEMWDGRLNRGGLHGEKDGNGRMGYNVHWRNMEARSWESVQHAA